MSADLWLQLLKAALLGGGICLLGQLLFDLAKLTPAHTMSILVSAGALLGGLGLYDKLVAWAGFGAKLPISSFGNTLVQGALEAVEKEGFIGIFSGMLTAVSTGVAGAVIFGFLIALVFRPKA
ncbi:MAG: stage V sporulation protein AE [Bacillota bacterium]|nr:stage V sporulation protein AE [Bacillota bacterium]